MAKKKTDVDTSEGAPKVGDPIKRNKPTLSGSRSTQSGKKTVGNPITKRGTDQEYSNTTSPSRSE